MKLFNKSILLLIFLLSSSAVNAQSILARNHDCSDTYSYTPSVLTSFDMNGDSVPDFNFYRYHYLAGSSSGDCLYIEPLGSNEVALGRFDTLRYSCGGPNTIRARPKVFALNDTINSKLTWVHDPCYFYETYAANLSVPCYTYLANNSNNSYYYQYNVTIGVRLISPTDTVYGWMYFINTAVYPIQISEHAYEAHYPQPTITQHYSVLTSNYQNGNQWYLNDTLIVGATAQTYTATQNGTYSLLVSTIYNCQWDTVSVTMTNVLVHELPGEKNMVVSPNPTHDNIYVAINTSQIGVGWELFGVCGTLIKSGNFDSLDNLVKFEDLAAGIYFLKIGERVIKLAKSSRN